MKIDPRDTTIRELLNGSYYVIPRFQRPYSWDRANVEELWEDAIQGGAADHFIGSMVTFKKNANTHAVVDGQQRLTTIVMLLCSLREGLAKAGDDKLANGTHHFIERSDEDDDPRFVVHPETSSPFLEDEILSRGDPALDASVGSEEAAIEVAFGRLTEYVEAVRTAVGADPKISKEDEPGAISAALKEIRDKVLALRVIAIEVGDQDQATTIFVTLNTRGKELEPADLVKAHLVQLLPQKGAIDKPSERWNRVRAKFDASSARIDMSTFLLTLWQSRYRYEGAGKLDKDVRRTIKKPDAERFLKEIEGDAELYRQIAEPGYRSWLKEERRMKLSLEFFARQGLRQPRPLLLALLREYGASRLKLKQVNLALEALEHYFFAHTVIADKSSSGGMSKLFARNGRELTDAKDGNERSAVIKQLRKDLDERLPSEDEFVAGFLQLRLTDRSTADRQTVLYVLRRHYEHEASGVADLDRLTVEHLKSQASRDDDVVGQIGNLILVDDALNGKLDSKAFAKKHELLAKAKNIWIPPEVLAAKSWGASAIEKRSKAFAEAAYREIWTIK